MIPHRDRDFRSSPEIGHVRSETPVTLLRNDRSRSIGIVGHVASETSVILVRNTHYLTLDGAPKIGGNGHGPCFGCSDLADRPG